MAMSLMPLRRQLLRALPAVPRLRIVNLSNVRHATATANPVTKRRRRSQNEALATTNNDGFNPSTFDPSLISSMSSCFETASLSPYLPVPHEVAHKMLEMAQVGPTDVHYELGSGDGRVNICAAAQHVQKSVGVEIDSSLIELSKELLLKEKDIPPNVITFVLADLMDPRNDIWNTMHDEATILTMYFVENALARIAPIMKDRLSSSGCRVVTCGYPVPDWTPVLVEKKRGLSIYLYEM